ncbi:11-beta-hydroxysteroid dehydrogenase A-like, partial [Quercus robur]|uniref:11-beta-hydroxysteroid dehydrogenase A-like n=1 Tax=Quercus robur TaxID=38942 RepID=UPI002163B520
VLLPLTLTAILLLLPPFLFLKYLFSLKRNICSENVANKVVLITGASSGIGEHIAYEYARRGAILALVARRENRLQIVANKAQEHGSPEVIVMRADVSKDEECKHFVDEIVNHFGQLDHLVNNAGVTRVDFFEESTDIASIMDINFWGSVYSTHYAVPHLRKSKGKIVVIASVAAWFGIPRLSFYNASKAAQVCFFETLRAEFGPDIGITIVTPRVIEPEMTQGPFVPKIQMPWMPAEPTERCAKAIVDSTCKGDMYLTKPSWTRVGFWMRVLCPEVFEWCLHSILVNWSRTQQNKDR